MYKTSVIPRDEKVAPATADRKSPKANLRPASSSHSMRLHQRHDSQATEGLSTTGPKYNYVYVSAHTEKGRGENTRS